MSFSAKYDDILRKIQVIDPVAYGKSRNFLDGGVTRLSPYISRGVVSTKMVMEHILNQGHSYYKVEKLLQELAWRDYWQQIWIAKGDEINCDLKQPQADYIHSQIPRAVTEGETGIHAIDQAIKEFYDTGYIHNHMRMYIASVTCNIGKSHWINPAKWMYYHLLDGDWASNALSWQWVAGSNASKKYYANQANINKYCHTDQQNTFLDRAYSEFYSMETPLVLREAFVPELKTKLPSGKSIVIDPNLPVLIYNYYNLDPSWRSEEKANRILLLEPSIFGKYPISDIAVNFMFALTENIQGIQLYVGEFGHLRQKIGVQDIIFKEHPLNFNYEGKEDPRDWMFSVKGHYPSFFNFWKRCKKELIT